jgi:hypothetical protein
MSKPTLPQRESDVAGHLVSVAPSAFWSELNPFLAAAAVFVAWLAVWGWLNRAQLQRQPPAPGTPRDASPAELPPHEQFAASGLDQQAPLWQQARRLHVQFDSDGRVQQAHDDAPRV